MFFLGSGSRSRQTVLRRLAALTLAATFQTSLPARAQSSQTPATAQSAASDATAFLRADYLPLNLGNRWIYTRAESRFKKTDTVRIEIISTPIIRWRTWYIFSQLPFAPGLESANNVPIRYDDDTKRFVRLAQEGELPLFPVGDDSAGHARAQFLQIPAELRHHKGLRRDERQQFHVEVEACADPLAS